MRDIPVSPQHQMCFLFSVVRISRDATSVGHSYRGNDRHYGNGSADCTPGSGQQVWTVIIGHRGDGTRYTTNLCWRKGLGWKTETEHYACADIGTRVPDGVRPSCSELNRLLGMRSWQAFSNLHWKMFILIINDYFVVWS